MDNRRECYRHPFDPDESMPVKVEDPAHNRSWEGQLVDLSVTGMCVRVPVPTPGTLPPARVTAKLFLDPAQALSVPVRLVHAESKGPGLLGFEFIESVDPRTNEIREKKLWAFLLQQQRRARNRTKSQKQAG
jgi:c-di-GMP-binding flagellar brake protein YcgR